MKIINKKTFLMVLFTVVLCLALTACGGTSTSGDADNPADTGINVAVYAPFYAPVENWDPSANFDNGIITLHNLYETLLRYEPSTDGFTHVIAESYTSSEDGLTWTFKIRKGMTFHDGTPVNAAAVKYSFERTVKMGKGAAFIWDPVESFEAPDEYTLVMKLKYAAAMDLVVSSAYGAFVMSPTTVEANGEDWLTAGNEAGSGPYMLESSKAGEQVVLAKYDGYWGGWKDDQFDKVVIQKVSESSTRRQMLENGEVDITFSLETEDFNVLKQNNTLNAEASPSYKNLFFLLNTEKAPLNNKLVRQAISYAFPYDDVIAAVAGGYAVQSRGAIPRGLWGHSEEIYQYTYDLDKAKELLAQAGYSEGDLELTFTFPTGNERSRKIGELFQSSLSQAGIKLVLQSMTVDMYANKARSENPNDRQDIASVYWWPDVPGPYTYLYSIYHSMDQISWNFTYYNNPAYDKLIDDAKVLTATDRDKAAQLYIEAQKILAEDAPSINILEYDSCSVYNKSFNGFNDNAAYPDVVFFYNSYRAK